MRQRIRYEPAIGIASSGIEYEMTGEREPPPAYHRHPRRFIKLAAHTTLLPVRRAERRRGGTGNGAGRQPTRRAGRRTQHRTIRPQERSKPMREMTEWKAIANERRARERYGNEASRQTVATPAAANRQQPTPPTPWGRGNNSSRQSDKSEREGVGREEKDIPHLYRSRGTLRIYPIQSQLRNRQASRPWVGIEKYDDEKKSPPSLPKKGKNKGASGGETPTGLIGRRKQAIDREKPLEKTINEPWIRHKKHYTRRHPSNQPIGRTSTKSTHSLPPHPRSKQRPHLLRRHEADHGGQQ